MNRRRVLIVLGAVGTAGLAGVAGYEHWAYRQMTLRRNLLIAGSRAAEEFVQAAAKEFARENPDMDIVVEGGNATAGLLALKRDSISLAIMSRDLTTAEDRPNLHSTLIGMEGVAIVMHPSMPVEAMKEYADLGVDRLVLMMGGQKPDQVTARLKAIEPALQFAG